MATHGPYLKPFKIKYPKLRYVNRVFLKVFGTLGYILYTHSHIYIYICKQRSLQKPGSSWGPAILHIPYLSQWLCGKICRQHIWESCSFMVKSHWTYEMRLLYPPWYNKNTLYDDFPSWEKQVFPSWGWMRSPPVALASGYAPCWGGCRVRYTAAPPPWGTKASCCSWLNAEKTRMEPSWWSQSAPSKVLILQNQWHCGGFNVDTSRY